MGTDDLADLNMKTVIGIAFVDVDHDGVIYQRSPVVNGNKGWPLDCPRP
jgi:hypothetical protein